MTTPDPQHIDAVAREACPGCVQGEGHQPHDDLGCAWAEQFAYGLLVSTDPAVHAAMLDALTRHGVLTRAWTVIGNDDEGQEWIVDALWAERDEAEQWARTHGGHVVGRLHEADWHEVIA